MMQLRAIHTTLPKPLLKQLTLSASVLNRAVASLRRLTVGTRRLKPLVISARCGAAEAAPFQNKTVQFAAPLKRRAFGTKALRNKSPSKQKA
jgi:hypothetical protein